MTRKQKATFGEVVLLALCGVLALTLFGCAGISKTASTQQGELLRDLDALEQAWDSVTEAYLADTRRAYSTAIDKEFEAQLRGKKLLSPDEVLAIDAERRKAYVVLEAKLADMRARLAKGKGHIDAARLRARGVKAVLDALVKRGDADDELTIAAQEAAKAAVEALK